MKRKSLPTILKHIKRLLEVEEELSVRQVSIKIKSSWDTTFKALVLLKDLGVVKERKGTSTNRDVRLFRLSK